MILELAGGALTAVGALFVLVGAVGVVRLPDVFARMHAAGVADTLGVALVLLGLCLQAGLSTATARMLLILGFLWLTCPTACHALARNALAAGLRPRVAEEPAAVPPVPPPAAAEPERTGSR